MLAVARAIIEPSDLMLITKPTKDLAPSLIDAMVGAFQEVVDTISILWIEAFGFRVEAYRTIAAMLA